MQLLARGIQAGYAAVGGAVRLATGRPGSAKERKRPGMPAGRARWCRGTHGGAGAGVAPESSGLVGRTLHLHALKPFPIAAEATGVPVATISRRDIRLDRRKPGSLFSPHVRAGPARQDSPRGSSRTRPGSTGPSLGSEHRWCRWGAAEDIHRGGRGAGSGMLPIEEGTVERWRRTVAAGSFLLGMAGAPLAQETLPRVGPEVGFTAPVFALPDLAGDLSSLIGRAGWPIGASATRGGISTRPGRWGSASWRPARSSPGPLYVRLRHRHLW